MLSRCWFNWIGSCTIWPSAPRATTTEHSAARGSIFSSTQGTRRRSSQAFASAAFVATRQHGPAVMLNLLGDLWFRGGSKAAVEPDWAAVLALPGAHLHLYGKTEARVGRKMGHLTFTGPDVASVRANALRACAFLGLEPF